MDTTGIVEVVISWQPLEADRIAVLIYDVGNEDGYQAMKNRDCFWQFSGCPDILLARSETPGTIFASQPLQKGSWVGVLVVNHGSMAISYSGMVYINVTR
jgi:hypothetical protein